MPPNFLVVDEQGNLGVGTCLVPSPIHVLEGPRTSLHEQECSNHVREKLLSRMKRAVLHIAAILHDTLNMVI